jgi:hypothetical protein
VSVGGKPTRHAVRSGPKSGLRYYFHCNLFAIWALLPPVWELRMTSMTGIDAAKHWRERADEARAAAKNVSDPMAQDTLLGIAARYDAMAVRAEGPAFRPATSPPQSLLPDTAGNDEK